MILANFISERWIGTEIDDIEDELESLQLFADQGTPSMILEDLEQAKSMGIEIKLFSKD